jgi:hypothetical protein
MLQHEDQVDICDHDGKAIILWKALKYRGKAENPKMDLYSINWTLTQNKC